MTRKRTPGVLHKLLFGDAGPDETFRALSLDGGRLLSHAHGREPTPCPAEWAARAHVIVGVDPELLLGNKLVAQGAAR
jgi:hypothetical protein